MSESKQHFGEDYGEKAPEVYEKYFVPSIASPLAMDLIATAALQPGERVLDVACGTGVVARLAAARTGPTGFVAGVDLNPGMLEVARSATPPDMTIEWHQSSAEKLPFQDASFDVVLCQLSLPFFPDKLAALREMRRVLIPNGRLALNVPGSISRVFTALAEGIGRHISPESEGFVRQVFSLPDPDELLGLLKEAGFKESASRSDTRTLQLPAPKEFLWQYVYSTPLAAAVAVAPAESRDALEEDVVARWQPFAEDGGMNYEQDVVMATARK